MYHQKVLISTCGEKGYAGLFHPWEDCTSDGDDSARWSLCYTVLNERIWGLKGGLHFLPEADACVPRVVLLGELMLGPALPCRGGPLALWFSAPL